MVVRLLPYLDDLLPLGLSIVTLAVLVPVLDLDRDLLARAGVAALGSAFAAYGLREVLRAWGGGYLLLQPRLPRRAGTGYRRGRVGVPRRGAPRAHPRHRLSDRTGA